MSFHFPQKSLFYMLEKIWPTHLFWKWPEGAHWDTDVWGNTQCSPCWFHMNIINIIKVHFNACANYLFMFKSTLLEILFHPFLYFQSISTKINFWKVLLLLVKVVLHLVVGWMVSLFLNSEAFSETFWRFKKSSSFHYSW